MIKEFGKVSVTSEGVTIYKFHFDNTKDGKIAGVEAAEWAIEELEKEIERTMRFK